MSFVLKTENLEGILEVYSIEINTFSNKNNFSSEEVRDNAFKLYLFTIYKEYVEKPWLSFIEVEQVLGFTIIEFNEAIQDLIQKDLIKVFPFEMEGNSGAFKFTHNINHEGNKEEREVFIIPTEAFEEGWFNNNHNYLTFKEIKALFDFYTINIE